MFERILSQIQPPHSIPESVEVPQACTNLTTASCFHLSRDQMSHIWNCFISWKPNNSWILKIGTQFIPQSSWMHVLCYSSEAWKRFMSSGGCTSKPASPFEELVTSKQQYKSSCRSFFFSREHATRIPFPDTVSFLFHTGPPEFKHFTCFLSQCR